MQTDDGYILTLHRIPNFNKTVVFLQHGLLSSSADWLLLGPGKALAFLLYDAGYDVWMGNTRGNTYSRNHVKLSPKTQSFWRFSWHEMAMHDLPAMIGLILERTNRKQLHYIGHSQGTTVFFVLASKKPKFATRIASAHLLAPVAYMGNMESPLVRIAAPVFGKPGKKIEILGSLEVFPTSRAMELLGMTFCNERSVAIELCANGMFLIGGFHSSNLNRTLIPEIIAIAPAGSSLRQVLHYLQEYLSKRFREWDYGPSMNVDIYGSEEPPDYPVKRIRVPMYLYFSKNDFLSSEVDVERMAQEVPKGMVKEKYLNPDHKFTHLDYLYGLNSKETVYNRVLENLMKTRRIP